MLTKKRHKGYLLKAGIIKQLKVRDWLTSRAQVSNNSTRAAKEVRNDFKDYFNSEHGKLSWQREIVQSITSLFD